MFTQDDNQPQANSVASNNQQQDITQSSTDPVIVPPAHDSVEDVQLNKPVQPSQEDRIDYVDSYSPPAQTRASVQEKESIQGSSPQSSPKSTEDALRELEELMKQAQERRSDESQSVNNQVVNNEQSEPLADTQASVVDSMIDPVSVDDSTVTPKMTMPVSTQISTKSQAQSQTKVTDSQELADQNIFFLLGAEDGSMEEQEQFLDELQQTVWDDFVTNDMALLITSEEKVKADEILNNPELDEMNKQEELLNYLDGLVPDLEEIMLEKALKLKEDLVRERVMSYRELFTQDQSKLKQLEEIQQLMTQNQWKIAGEKLNQIE